MGKLSLKRIQCFSKSALLSSLLLCGVVSLHSNKVFSQKKNLEWKAKVPSRAEDPELWSELLLALEEQKLYYGIMAASLRSLMFFDSVEVKKQSYRNLIGLVDLGYPHSILRYFSYGDLEVEGSDVFPQAYNFYKALLNEKRRMKRWADDYFKKVEKDKFKKYLFYQVIDHYAKKEFEPALKLIDEILKSPLDGKDFTFAKKVIRTKARILFEQKEYKKSLKIYDDFLLKVNPVTANDFVEKAWNLYYLKNYADALGTLYNLESPNLDDHKSFEKYIIRASIFLDLCAVDSTKKLVSRFAEKYGDALDGITRGKPLKRYKDIRKIAEQAHPRFGMVVHLIKSLTQEMKKLDGLDSDVQALAKYLYRTELRMLYSHRRFYEERAYRMAAEKLTMLAESLKFLEFGTQREKYNPSVVFRPKKRGAEELVYEIDLGKKGFVFSWYQLGNFWRDERSKYKADVKDECAVF